MNLNKKANNFCKICNGYVGAIAGILMLVAPFITQFVDNAQDGDNLKQDLSYVIKNLNEYKKAYGFGKYEEEFSIFLKNCNILLEIVDSMDNVNNPKILNIIETYMAASQKVEELGAACKGYLGEMKGAASKAFDATKIFFAGYDTVTTASERGIDNLYKRLSMNRPKIEKLYNQLTMKVKDELGKVSMPEEFNDLKDKQTPLDEFAEISF